MSYPEPKLERVPLPDGDDVPIPTKIERISQDEFIHEIFVPGYEPGQHVAFLGPTRCGKTTLAYKLMDELATPKLPAVVLVKKPKDPIVKDFSKNAGFKITETWPPILRRGMSKKSGGVLQKRRGWVFWPQHSLQDIKRDNKMLEKEFRKALTECYRKGNRIVFADDVIGMSKELHLEDELTQIWSEGGAMECGLWAAAQRPFHAPVIMYSQSAHLMIFNDGDKRSRERYRDIGGIEGDDVVSPAVLGLKKHEFLYIGRFMADDGVSPALAIVNAN